jgi:hypothetical protein
MVTPPFLIKYKRTKMVDINSRIEGYQRKWLKYLGRMEQNRFPKLLADYKPRDRGD